MYICALCMYTYVSVVMLSSHIMYNYPVMLYPSVHLYIHLSVYVMSYYLNAQQAQGKRAGSQDMFPTDPSLRHALSTFRQQLAF